MRSERPTFSPMWHRVRAMAPRLRPHVQITRQHYRGRRWHVAHDPTSNQFYRLSPVAHEFVGLLDGHRTVEGVWNISLSSHGDSAPTQPEVIELLTQLYNSNLLTVDASPETEQLLARGRERTKRRIQQQAIGLMYFRIRLFNPDALLTWIEPIFRPLINRWGLLAWLALVIVALTQLLPHWQELSDHFSTFRANPTAWLWMPVVFIITKALHELGHGVICKRFGGQVPEFGFMLLVMFPSPYVDASACWAFPSKWQRTAVGAGGMLFELAIAALAAFVWLNTPTGDLLHDLAFNAMLMASVTTVLFNANPLMRFDGYYMLSDLIEVPNLMQRSMKMLQHVFQRHVYRIKEARPPTTDRGEAAILHVYGWAALAYRIFLFFSITLFVMGQFFAVGVFLAFWSAAAWFLLPTGKFVHWLATSPQLADRRGRAVLLSLAMIAGGAALVGLVPVPDHRRGQGVVESVARSGVFFVSDGFITEVYHGAGEFVRAGEPVLRQENPDLVSRHRLAQAELAEAETLERDMTTRDAAAAEVARERVRVQSRIIAAVQERLSGLVVRAPHDGVLVPVAGGPDPRALIGVFAQRGQAIGEVVDPARTRITASLPTAVATPLIELGADRYRVEVRLLSAPERSLVGHGVRLIESGRRELQHAALGYAGGGSTEVDPKDRTMRSAMNPQFTLYVDELELKGGDGSAAAAGVPGERVRLRFTLPNKPLLSQWIDRLRRLMQGRIDV